MLIPQYWHEYCIKHSSNGSSSQGEYYGSWFNWQRDCSPLQFFNTWPRTVTAGTLDTGRVHVCYVHLVVDHSAGLGNPPLVNHRCCDLFASGKLPVLSIGPLPPATQEVRLVKTVSCSNGRTPINRLTTCRSTETLLDEVGAKTSRQMFSQPETTAMSCRPRLFYCSVHQFHCPPGHPQARHPLLR
jgi:hypothetical protein